MRNENIPKTLDQECPSSVPRKYERPDVSPAFSHRTDVPHDFGAGEGIRTLDPNLGKVVLYP